MFNFAEWLQIALPVGALLSGLNLAAVQGLGKMGLSGNAQLIGAGVSGLVLGIAGNIAFFGMPTDFLGWFLAVIFGLIVFGGSVGTYEAIKHAAAKSAE